MSLTRLSAIFTGLAAFFLASSPATAQTNDLQASFDSTFGTEPRNPESFNASYETSFERQIATLADGDLGRIGVYAVDLSTGEEISVLADQRFPMASTSKVAVAATFLAGVDQGRWSLTSEFPLLIPVKSKKFSSASAPVRTGNYVPAYELIGLMISKSCNSCTDALLRVVGGPEAVNAWMRNAGIADFELSRDIATLVRDDGEYDPAAWIDPRDSATPRAMGQLLAGIYEGRWLSARSRGVLLGAMEETTTGKRRMPAALPGSAYLAHKTGTLSRTASDIGIFQLPDGRTVAAAIYVTGQSANLIDEARNKRTARKMRDARIADITRALYNGFASKQAPERNWTNAPRTGG
ncbi:MAG: serine hydrolase [Pseudomonadota bacterium]